MLNFLPTCMTRRDALKAALALCAQLAVMDASHAQPIKPEILQATSVDALLSLIGATKAQDTGRLELQFPEIAPRGPLQIRARSEIPGTVSMILVAGAPNAWYSKGQVGSAPTPPAQSSKKGPEPVVLKAWQVPAGTKPVMRVTFPNLERRQAFTFLAFAQGRWNVTVREAKVACTPDDCTPRPGRD